MEKEKSKTIQNKQPEFFSYGYTLLMRTFNWLLVFYTTFSLIVYLFYYFLNENVLQKKWFDEKFIISNSYYAGLVLLQVTLSVFSLYKKYVAIFSIYMIYSIAMDTVLVLHWPGNNMHLALMWTVIAITAFNLANIVYFYLKSIGYFKDKLVGVNNDSIVHEVRLRTDMMKINFNSHMINSGMGRLFPSMLFKKEDYYFMNKDKIIESEKLDEPLAVKNNYSIDNSSGFHSKSTIESEWEPLK
jgi:hypothetical protein